MMQKRLFIGMTAMLTLVIALMSLLSFNASSSASINQVDAQLESSWALVEDALEVATETELGATVARLWQPSTLRITLIDTTGGVIAESENEGGQLSDNHAYREEVKVALAGGEGRAQRFSVTERQQMRYFAKLSNQGYVVRVATPVALLTNYQSDVLRRILISALIAMLLSIVLTFIFTRGVVRPLSAWTNWASAVARDPKEPLNPPEAALSVLSDPIKQLVAALSGTVMSMSHQTNELNEIMNGMQSGLIALGHDGCIIQMNRQAREWFDVKRMVPNQNLIVATQQPSLNALLLGQDEVELQLAGRTLNARYMKLDGDAGELLGLIWLEDMTEQKSVERQRREFAANVSHEMKTPLTAIQGAADSLRAEGITAPEREQLTGIIEHEVKWLSALMSDLLMLSRVESMYQDLDVEEMDVRDVIQDVMRANSAQAKARDVTITSDIKDATIRANYSRLRQLIGNLVDNAIKYNVQGGRVKIAASADGVMLNLSVSDTGIGIPEYKRPRVFERFYRADESHSRSELGTGLGLSIVKHIVKLYGGKIRLESGEAGTTFILQLPIVVAEVEEN